MVGLVIKDIETQCEVMNCSILTTFIKEKSQNKTWVDLMLQLSDQRNKELASLRHTEIFLISHWLSEKPQYEILTTKMIENWKNWYDNYGTL